MNIRHNSYIMLSIIFFCFSLTNHLSFGTDTISVDESLSGDQTIVSSGGIFELGFFKPGNSSNFYIGIWYKKISPQTVVWVANRETPISNKYSSELKILNGNVVLLNESQTTIWSTNINSTNSNSVVATLLDDGNFVLKDGSSNSTESVWQSFDYPTHTFLPGSKIGINKRTNVSQVLTSWKNSEDPSPGLFSLHLDPNDNQYLLRWNKSETYWISGSWDGQKFRLTPEMVLSITYNFTYVSNENESYFTYSLNDQSVTFLNMDVSGRVKQLTWLFRATEWSLFWSKPSLQCEVHAYCGAFGTCYENVQPPCNCLPGFVPKYGKDWSLSDFSGGCVRRTSLQCGVNSTASGKKDRFKVKQQMVLHQNGQSVAVGTVSECESICLNNCTCNAYAYDSNGCSIWNGELLNVEQLTNDSAARTLYVRLAASEFSSPKNRKVVVIVSVVGSVATLGLVIILWRWKNKHGGRNKSFHNTSVLSTRQGNMLNNDVTQSGNSDVPFFHLESIIAATNGFSDASKLGEGGFGQGLTGSLLGSGNGLSVFGFFYVS